LVIYAIGRWDLIRCLKGQIKLNYSKFRKYGEDLQFIPVTAVRTEDYVAKNGYVFNDPPSIKRDKSLASL